VQDAVGTDSLLGRFSCTLCVDFLVILAFEFNLRYDEAPSPCPLPSMRATAASRHVARTYSGKPDVMIDHYNLPEHITPPCSLRRFTFFKDRNKLADQREVDRLQHV